MFFLKLLQTDYLANCRKKSSKGLSKTAQSGHTFCIDNLEKSKMFMACATQQGRPMARL